MRIGVDVSILDAPRAGIARYLVNTLREMLQADTQHDFLLYSDRATELALPEGNWRMRVSGGRLPRLRALWVQRDLARALRADQVDVFWGQNYRVPRSIHRGCRLLVTVHDIAGFLVPNTMPISRRLNSRLHLAGAVRRADHVVTVSLSTAHQLTRVFGLNPMKLSVVHPGCDGAFGPIPPPRVSAVIQSRFGLSPGYLIAVGTLEPRKNLGVLLDAIDRIKHPPPLVVVGQLGWRYGSVLRQLRRQQRSGRVLHLTNVSDVDLAALYCGASLMVFPSLYEGFGSPVLEAMACACPVLCSWSSSLPEVGGQAAAYFHPRHPAELAAKIGELMNNREVRREMASAGPVQAARFSYPIGARRLLELMQNLIEGGPV